jgi:transcriptional regulator with XRE-family HTH domain
MNLPKEVLHMPDIIDNVKVGEHIKMLLKKHNMTQDDLAEKLSISKSAVSQNLRGKSAFDIHNLIQIAKLFNISLEVLLKLKSDGDDEIVSEYQRVVKKGLKAIKDVPPADLKISEPDLYGKVLIDYVIDQREVEMFKYLVDNEVKLVEDYYHRAKDVYIKIILYCLEENFEESFDFILKYSKLHGSFQMNSEEIESLMWTLLNKQENQDIVKELVSLKTTIKVRLKKLTRTNETIIPLTRKDFVYLIAKHHLDVILKTYLELQENGDDLLYFTKTMIDHQYADAVIQYVQVLYSKPTSWMSRLGNDRQKAMMLVIESKHFDLIEIFVRNHLYTDLTEVIKRAIELKLEKVISHLIANYSQSIQFRKIAQKCIEFNDLSLLSEITHLLDQDDMNYLLSWTNCDDYHTNLFLILRGAHFDEKYYNMQTFKKANAIIKYLLEKRGQ